MRSAIRARLMIMGLLLTLVLPGSGLAAEGTVEPHIMYHLQLATDIGTNGLPQNTGDVFPEGTPYVVALQGWGYVPAGTELRLRIYLGDRLEFEDARRVEHETDAGVIFLYRPEGGLVAGDYIAEMAYNGVPDEITPFTVIGATEGMPGPGTSVDPEGPKGDVSYASPDDVLVVTCGSILREGLGEADFARVISAAARVGTVQDLDATGTGAGCGPLRAPTRTRALLRAGGYDYLLILGNDDAIPFVRVPNPMGEDEEDALVDWELPAEWLPSDDPYGDLDGDPLGIPDVGVARLPSSDDAELLLTQLGENETPAGSGFALVNQKRRNQAATVIDLIDDMVGVRTHYSPPTEPDELAGGGQEGARFIYVLLHGIGVLTNEWSGDVVGWTPYDPDNELRGEWRVSPADQLISADISSARAPGAVMNVGACYGAWTLDTSQEPQRKNRTNSLALAYLASGTRAFIADTHLSYSTLVSREGPYRGRTGFEVLFWTEIVAGARPIDAYLAAKKGIGAELQAAIDAGDGETAALNAKTLAEMIYLGRP